MRTKPETNNLDASDEPPKSASWLEKTRWHIENEDWLDESFNYALDILQAMEDQNLERADLAERLGVSRQSVHQYLSGKQNFTLKLKHRIQNALGIQFTPLVQGPDGEPRRANALVTTEPFIHRSEWMKEGVSAPAVPVARSTQRWRGKKRSLPESKPLPLEASA